MNKFLFQIFVPLADNNGQRFPGDWYGQIGCQLNERFGGVTIYQRAPVTGLWKEEEQHTMKDELIIYEVIADELELAFLETFQARISAAIQAGKYFNS